MGKEQKKKKKVIYVDDGSTIADMSGISGSRPKAEKKQNSRFREIFSTYIQAVKLMFLPMLVVLGIIALAFLIVYIIL